MPKLDNDYDQKVQNTELKTNYLIIFNDSWFKFKRWIKKLEEISGKGGGLSDSLYYV